MTRRLTLILLGSLLGLAPARAEPVSRREVLAAIAVLERDVTSDEAIPAAETVTRFGQESDTVLITIGEDTLPWMQEDVSESEARVRAMLMAAYFAGDIKAQLTRRRTEDDPYSGWLAAIRAYRQIRRKQPDVTVPEIEELIAMERAGTLKGAAEKLRHPDPREQQNDMI
jgi:hypothetical protein